MVCALTGEVTGTSCNSPPACNAAPILCATHREAWAQRCAQEIAASDGGSCQVPPFCDKPDDPACVSMQIQWRGLCGIDENGQRTADAVELLAEQFAPGEGEQPSPLPSDPSAVFEGSGGAGEPTVLDTTAFFGASSCPQFPSVQVLGVSVDLNAGGAFCDIGLLLRGLLLLMAGWASARIVAGIR